MIRSIIFWSHLCSGVLTGLIVFTMSITGVLLTYERQINQWEAQKHYVPAENQHNRMPLEQLISLQALAQAETPASAVTITNDAGAPVSFRAGRRGGVSLNPYTGEAMEVEDPEMAALFSWLTGFHRWFNVEGENRAVARQVTGISNVIFLFLVLSGMYLWLPKIYHWAMFKVRLLFNAAYPNSKARDFHWHHIFGIWAALPLVAVVYSGAVISYPWAANVMYSAFGAEIPAAPAGPPGARSGQNEQQTQGSAPQQESLTHQPLDALLAAALVHHNGDWNRMTVNIPQTRESTLTLEIDEGNGAQAQHRYSMTLDRSSGALLSQRGFSDMPQAQRLRTTARFLHTGEVLGFWGQTIAGLVSLAALFLVWTGFALSWRRLIQPLFRKR